MSNKKLYKSEKDIRILGVCGGIAEYLNVSSTVVRILCAIGIFFTAGTGVIMYLVAALIMPKESRVTKNMNQNDIID